MTDKNNMDEAFALLVKLLEIPSVNSHDKEQCVAEYIAAYFQEHGIEARVQYIDDTHANVEAFVPGKDSARTMIWNGHLDTVPYGSLEEWKSAPESAVLEKGKLYARGASDMKSGLAAMVYALCHAQEPPAYNIQFFGTCDEEKNGIGARAVLEENRMREAECLLIGEPTGMELGIAQKGCIWLELLIRGKTSHGAYPREGISAIHCGVRMAEVLKSYVETHSFGILGNATAQITMIQGGTAPNMTADECRILMDIRIVPGLTKEMVLLRAEELLAKEKRKAAGLSADFSVLNFRRAIEIDENHPMSAALRRILQEHGYEGGNIGINFFTDASVLDSAGKKSVLLFGPGEPSMAHKPNEYVSVKKYEDAIRILQDFMREGIT